MINRETIDEVKNRVDIVDVVSDFVSLKKSGQNYKALSPFANEKTPSFFVVPSKGIFKDFSSGKGGDAFTFVMEHEKLSYAETIRYLAKKYGVEIKEDKLSDENRAEQSEREGLYILMNFAKDFYKDILLTHEEGRSIGLSYFRERGFNDRTIEKFELGYALEGWENFSKEAVSKGYNKELLEKTGLVVKKEDPDGSVRTYDRFRGRVIFPVHNISGKVLAFGARMMGKDKNQPKYINSPETEIYHKSDVLYGLYQGKNAIRNKENCYLVEGYTDVISMHQADVENVVASSGTALTEGQIRLIHRFTENVTVLFDGDSAGIKAALRGIDMILKGGLNVRVVLFPDGEDPDSYSRKIGTAEFQKFLKEKAQDFLTFKIALLSSDIDDPIKKIEALNEIFSTLALMPSEVKRSPYYKQINELLGVREEAIITAVNRIRISSERDTKKEPKQEKKIDEVIDEKLQDESVILPEFVIYRQEAETIRLLLNYAASKFGDQNLSSFLISELEDVEFTNPIYREIFEEYRKCLLNGKILDIQHFMKDGNEPVKKAVSDLIMNRYEASQHWGDKYKIFFPKENDILNQMALTNVLRLKFRVVQKMMDDNLAKVKVAEQKSDWDELDKALETQAGLKKAESELAGLLGIVVAK